MSNTNNITGAKNMKGLTALITGGSSGIGLATARLLADQGVNIVLVGRQLSELNEAAKSLSLPAAQVHCITGDVSSEGYANKMILDTKKRFGAVNILVNCAGVFRGGRIQQQSEEDFDHVCDINLKGTWFMCKFAARDMFENGSEGGAIVNVASTMGKRSRDAVLGAAYAAAKGGVIALTNALAVELAPKIRVNCVVPGAVKSPTYDLMSHFTVDAVESIAAAVGVSSTQALQSTMAAKTVSQSMATVEQVAEAIVALANPLSDWVTGEKIVIGD
jgi:NAD(P)-dependent dehydrogenase (short-subunit alcohol dehydrogenase family)